MSRRLAFVSAAGGAAIAFAVLGAGCAVIQNTPRQDLAWTRWSRCRAEAPDASIRTIEPDGRIRFEAATSYDRTRVLACLETLSAAGPRLPEPIVEAQPRGGGG